MYKTLKTLVRLTLPKPLLFKLERPLRYIAYWFSYRGSNHKCNLCDADLKCFIQQSNDLLCPRCGSLNRTRLLYHLLKTQLDLPSEARILHFSPQRYLMHRLKKQYGRFYTSTDYLDSYADEQLDITNLHRKDESLNLVICYHVFEHVPNDRQGMKELYRVLKKGGTAILQVPFRDGEMLEDLSVTDPQERLRLFGQEDHVRYYNLPGLTQRLREAGFKVNPATPARGEEKAGYFGWSEDEVVVLAKKE